MTKIILISILFLIGCSERYQHTKYVDKPVIITVTDDKQIEALYRMAEEGLKVCQVVDGDYVSDVKRCITGYLTNLNQLKNSFKTTEKESEFDTSSVDYEDEF